MPTPPSRSKRPVAPTPAQPKKKNPRRKVVTKHMRDPNQPAPEKRRLQVLDLRLAGATYREIGAQLHIGIATVQDDLKKAMGELTAEQNEKAATLRTLEAARLDRVLLVAMGQLGKGDNKTGDRIKAGDLVLKVSDRRAKLFGLDKPIQHSISLAAVDELASTIGAIAFEFIPEAKHDAFRARLQEAMTEAGQTDSKGDAQ